MSEQLASAKLCAFLFAALACMVACKPALEGEPVNLEPNDPRPILSLEVGDSDEAALLVQELDLEPVRMEGSTLYFFENDDQLNRLKELGYELRQQNSYEVFRRVVRIDRTVPEEELRASGIRVINREENYLVVEGSLAKLRALERAGSSMVAVGGHEPRPRQVRITAESMDDVAEIGAMAVDIYSVERADRAKPDRAEQYRDGEIVVLAGAFDYQIDQLTAAGYSVEVFP